MSERIKKRVAILGSTGSIGTQTLDVINNSYCELEVELLTAYANSKLLIEQARKYKPNHVVIVKEDLYQEVRDALSDLPIKVYSGIRSVEQIVEMDSIDVVLTAMVGYAGLAPTISAIKAGKNIALANKETMVVAGELITELALEKGISIYPVDSEHSAIFQSIVGEFHNPIEKIYLTASGGPFRGKSKEFMELVTPAQALKHPNWTMGAKITIDSATLMNKGLEAIEAKWLFDLKPEQIDIIVHPQSIIHSLVQFEDGSMKAQMGLPDMRLPIQFALTYPNRVKTSFPRFDFTAYPNLSFEQADRSIFRSIDLAYAAMRKGGNMPCILNAANEVAVESFLKEKIGFLQMADMIEKVMQKVSFISKPDLDAYHRTDCEARSVAEEMIRLYIKGYK